MYNSKRYTMKQPDVVIDSVNWHDWFKYDPESHTFLTNAITRSPKAQEGNPTGCLGSKEIKVQFKGKFYRHSRIIWEMFNGPIPPGYSVGFKDNNEFNLLIENLVIRSPRQRGLHTRQPVGVSGLKGVRANKSGKFVVYAKVHGKTRYLGTYPSPEAAVKARKYALSLNN